MPNRNWPLSEVISKSLSYLSCVNLLTALEIQFGICSFELSGTHLHLCTIFFFFLVKTSFATLYEFLPIFHPAQIYMCRQHPLFVGTFNVLNYAGATVFFSFIHPDISAGQNTAPWRLKTILHPTTQGKMTEKPQALLNLINSMFSCQKTTEMKFPREKFWCNELWKFLPRLKSTFACHRNKRICLQLGEARGICHLDWRSKRSQFCPLLDMRRQHWCIVGKETVSDPGLAENSRSTRALISDKCDSVHNHTVEFLRA